MWFVGCRTNDDYEPSPQTIQSETDDFTNWAQARSGRWFTFLIGKAIEENPDVPKEELLTVVDSYFGLLLNAQRYYRNQFIHNTGFSATTVDEYLEKQYRVHYPKLDTAINDSTLMETLYQRYLELPTLPVQQSKNKFDKNSLRMGGGEIPTYSCTPPWEMTNFLTLYGGVPIYDDYYFHFFPMTPEEELETIIGKLSWLLIVMPNLHQHTDFLEEFYYLAGNPTMDDYSTVCDGIKAHVSLLIWDYHFLAGTTPDPEDPFPPGGGGPGSGGPGSGDPDPPPFNQNNDCQGALKADEMKIVPGIDSILNTIVNSPYEIGHHFYLSDKADPYSMYIGPARTDSSPSSWSPHYTWDSSNGYAIGSIHNHPGQSPPSPSDALAGIRITEMRLFFPNEVDFLTKNNVTIVVDTTYYLYDHYQRRIFIRSQSKCL